MPELQTVDGALARVLERVRPLDPETIQVESSVGRVLADEVRARVDLPPFASSAMDGFAVRAADTPGRLAVSLRIPAGRPATRALRSGEAMGIATGAVVPAGADAVVPIEDVSDHGDGVEIPLATAPGANIRRRGGDVGAGDLLLSAGTILAPHRLAAATATGAATVTVTSLPRVVILTTGSELRGPGESLRPGQIHESNGPMLAALFARAGATIERLHPVADDEDAHRAALKRALGGDVLVTSGGVSVGPHDLVRRITAELGVEEVFWGVAMRPGKPLAFGVRGRTLVFGLPGNPVSSLVSALLFVVPAIRALQGDPSPEPRFQQGTLGSDLPRNPTRDDFVRARLRHDDIPTLAPLVGQESHMIATTAAADALVRVPRGSGVLPAGSSAAYLLLDGPTGA